MFSQNLPEESQGGHEGALQGATADHGSLGRFVPTGEFYDILGSLAKISMSME
jgi:hypothetical protein